MAAAAPATKETDVSNTSVCVKHAVKDAIDSKSAVIAPTDVFLVRDLKNEFTEHERWIAVHLMRWGVKWDEEMNLNCHTRVLVEKEIVDWIHKGVIPGAKSIMVGDPETGKFEPMVRPFEVNTIFAVFCRALRCYRREMIAITSAKIDKDTLAALRCVLRRMMDAGLNVNGKFEHPLSVLDQPVTVKDIAEKDLPIMAELLTSACA